MKKFLFPLFAITLMGLSACTGGKLDYLDNPDVDVQAALQDNSCKTVQSTLAEVKSGEIADSEVAQLFVGPTAMAALSVLSGHGVPADASSATLLILKSGGGYTLIPFANNCWTNAIAFVSEVDYQRILDAALGPVPGETI